MERAGEKMVAHAKQCATSAGLVKPRGPNHRPMIARAPSESLARRRATVRHVPTARAQTAGLRPDRDVRQRPRQVRRVAGEVRCGLPMSSPALLLARALTVPSSLASRSGPHAQGPQVHAVGGRRWHSLAVKRREAPRGGAPCTLLPAFCTRHLASRPRPCRSIARAAQVCKAYTGFFKPAGCKKLERASPNVCLNDGVVEENA